MWNEAVEVIEATEAVEAVEVIEATDILRPGKSLLSTPESSRLLNLALFWCFETHIFLVESWNITFEFLHLFCWRLLKPAKVNFLKIGWWNSNVYRGATGAARAPKSDKTPITRRRALAAAAAFYFAPLIVKLNCRQVISFQTWKSLRNNFPLRKVAYSIEKFKRFFHENI